MGLGLVSPGDRSYRAYCATSIFDGAFSSEEKSIFTIYVQGKMIAKIIFGLSKKLRRHFY